MRARGRALCGGLASTPTLAAPPPEDDTVLRIDAGRLLVMLDQISTRLKVQTVEPSTDEPSAELAFAIARYNQLRTVACGRALVEGPSCTASFSPTLGDASKRRSDLDYIEARIHPFWEAICTKLDNPAQHTCQLE